MFLQEGSRGRNSTTNKKCSRSSTRAIAVLLECSGFRSSSRSDRKIRVMADNKQEK